MSWQIENVNLDGVAARTGPGAYVEPETGPYAVKITGTEAYEKEGKTSVKFQCVIDESEFAGSETRIFIGTDLSKVGNQRSWKTALLSVGQRADGTLNIAATQFDGKRAYIYYKAKDPNDASSQSERTFITPEAYQTLKANAPGAPAPASAPAPATPAPAASGSASTAAPAPSGGGRLRSLIKN